MAATSPTAIITGVTGQDGWHLASQLVAAGYRVIGTTRGPVDAGGETPPGVEPVHWDLKDEDALADLLRRSRPAEFFNFAARATGAGMFDDPVGMGDANGLAVTRILEGIRVASPSTRFCQASSSEMFGAATAGPQTEASPFRPLSPYGAAKLYAHEMVGIYRRRHGIFACSAILFNHESSRRGAGFVTRKVSDGVARIKLGLAAELTLGDLAPRRDWGFSGDYVRGAWLMLQSDQPGDYVLATGTTHSIRDLCKVAFAHVGLDYRDYVRRDQGLIRPVNTGPLVGDATKARTRLDWSPRVTFRQLVRDMVDADLDRLRLAGRPGEAR